MELSNPKTFNEKIQWLKLYWRPNYITDLVDKIKVRIFVEEKIGDKYLNTILGTYSSYEEFFNEINSFPERYVIKANHGSGWNIIINENNRFNPMEHRVIMDRWLGQNYYKIGREWVYKNVKPKILVERYIEPSFMREYGLLDFKIFCFSGRPLYIQVDFNREKNHKRNIYDLEWNLLKMKKHYDNLNINLVKPKFIDDILYLCEKLSKNIPYCRIDFYYAEKIIFGEITFYPGNGFEQIYPFKFDRILGKSLVLPNSK